MTEMKEINKAMLSLAVPSILAGITIPLVGMVDMAIAGHLGGGTFPAATLIGGITVGSTLFDLLYWNFGFLRAGTGGLTAQAFGRGDRRAQADILFRSLGIALVSALVLILLQTVFLDLAFLVVKCSPEARILAGRYFRIRILAAPATLGLMAVRGWFIGMQDALSSMKTDLLVVAVNIGASLLLGFGLCSWKGLGYDGIATGTVLAQYAGLAFAAGVLRVRYGKGVLADYGLRDARAAFRSRETGRFLRLGGDLFFRSLCLILIHFGYTLISARYGDLMLAAGAIILKLMLLFSYFTDGFAYAGETLTGRFIGSRETRKVRMTVRCTFAWSLAIAGFFMLLNGLGSGLLFRVLTSDADVAAAADRFVPWLVAVPLIGCGAYVWDGIYIGATASRPLRDASILAVALFVLIWWAGSRIGELSPDPDPAAAVNVRAIHLLLAAYAAHLLVRTLYQSLCYRTRILARLPAEG